MPYSVGLYTLGCKVSQYETEAIAERFAELGFTVSDFSIPCDVYVVNTCTVTSESDRKSRQIIRRALRTNPNAIVMVTGCYSQLRPEEITDIPNVSYVSGNDRKMVIPERAIELLSMRKRGEHRSLCEVNPIGTAPFEKMTILHAPRTRAYVKIEDGCECKCAYCTIPFARGPVRSKLPEDVIKEVTGLVSSGTREVVLTGIETASYGVDFQNYRLIDLLEDLTARTGIERIRFGSLSPEMMTPSFVERLAKVRGIAPHFHLSMQSGSNDVLHRMRRRYSAERALASIEDLRAHIPDVMFTTDMVVGFPGETEENFRETMDFAKEARFLMMHVFPYSKRPGTPAAEFTDQVEEQVKHERVLALSKLGREIRRGLLSEVVSAEKPIPVLFETKKETETGTFWTGHSHNFIEITVPSDANLHGEILPVHPVKIVGEGLLGDLLANNQ